MVKLKRYLPWSIIVVAVTAFLVALTFRLDVIPSLTWDEAWTLSAARNWVERGHFGQFLNNQPAPPGMSAALPVVAPIALSFRLFGVGVWQGRLPFIIWGLCALCILYILSRRFFSSPVAWGVLFIVVFLTPYPVTNIVLVTRQGMAELMMVFFLLLGYYCIERALQRPLWLILAILAWAFAITSKTQPLYFWLLSLFLPAIWAFLAHRWRIASLLILGLSGTLVLARGISIFGDILLDGHTLPNLPLSGLVQVTAMNLSAASRYTAWLTFLLLGLPIFSGLVYAAYDFYSRLNETQFLDKLIIPLSLWIFCVLWLGWYLALSVGWPRYFFPVLFMASPFMAKAFYEWTGGYQMKTIALSIRATFKSAFFFLNTLRILWVLLWVAFLFALTLMQWQNAYDAAPGETTKRLVAYLHQETDTNALLESYESEVLFAVERPHHFPSDQLNVDVIRSFGDDSVSIIYDPFVADPDYIVVGAFGRLAKIYENVPHSSRFTLVYEDGPYQVYKRLRE